MTNGDLPCDITHTQVIRLNFLPIASRWSSFGSAQRIELPVVNHRSFPRVSTRCCAKSACLLTPRHSVALSVQAGECVSRASAARKAPPSSSAANRRGTGAEPGHRTDATTAEHEAGASRPARPCSVCAAAGPRTGAPARAEDESIRVPGETLRCTPRSRNWRPSGVLPHPPPP